MRKLRCVLVEDEKPAQEILETYLSNYEMLELKAYFRSIPELQTYLSEHEVDVLFLDIQLPGMTGMDFLDNVNVKPLVVITTAYDEHAVKAFEVNVFDYLLKPYSPGRFSQTVEKLLSHFQKMPETQTVHSQTIMIKSSIQKFKVEVADILYIESRREYMHFFLKDGKEIDSRMTVKECLDLIRSQRFIQIHRSFIVNMDHIESAGTDFVYISGQQIPIGEMYKLGFRKSWE